jgi:hypothetical protein
MHTIKAHNRRKRFRGIPSPIELPEDPAALLVEDGGLTGAAVGARVGASVGGGVKMVTGAAVALHTINTSKTNTKSL